jgi:hypothetical protein
VSRDDATLSLLRAHRAGRACFAHAPRDHDRDNDRNLGHDQIAR